MKGMCKQEVNEVIKTLNEGDVVKGVGKNEDGEYFWISRITLIYGPEDDLGFDALDISNSDDRESDFFSFENVETSDEVYFKLEKLSKEEYPEYYL